MKNFSEIKKVSYSGVFALATLLVVGVLRDKIFISILLLSVCSICLLIIDGNKKTIRLFFLVFILGPLAEALAIYFGAWDYSNPFILGVPLYLPFVWGNASIYIKRLDNFIESL